MLYATSRLQKIAGLFHDSLIHAKAAFSLKSSLPCIENHIESLKNAIVSRWHFAMLNDKGFSSFCMHKAFLLLSVPIQFGMTNISVPCSSPYHRGRPRV